jgi:hypothetical protein
MMDGSALRADGLIADEADRAAMSKTDAGGKATKKRSANQWVSTGH